jgi:putative ABC transport system permease protein
MLKNYLKVALRNLFRYKGYTFINVAGLSVGIACCILIMLFVKSEWSFDRFHSKEDRIFRAWLEEHYQGEYFRNTATPIPLGPVLKEGLPECEYSCRVSDLKPELKVNNQKFHDIVNIVDITFFKIFDFPFAEGNPKDPFPLNNSVILTKKAAKKYFGNLPAMGKQMEFLIGDDKHLFTVSAIAEDPPLESTIQFEMLIPFSNASHIWSEKARTSAWSSVAVETYLLLRKNADVSTVNSKISTIMNPLVTDNYKPGEYLVRLQPLSDIHFNTALPEELTGSSDPKYSYILSSIGFLILLIACINFVTLSIGRSATRSKEVGMRKVMGAERYQLIWQFWGEAILLTAFAALIGIAIAFILQTPFSNLANRSLVLSFNFFTLVFCVLLAVVIALFAGIYPALILSNYKPVHVLKGKIIAGTKLGIFRRALIIGQFVASIILIICTVSVGRQLNYLTSKDLGYDKDHIVIVSTNKKRQDGVKLAMLYKNTLENNPGILSATVSLYSMAESGWMSLGYTDNNKVFRQFKFNAVDADFFSTMNFKIIKGRSFLKNNPTDSNYIVVNEALVKEYGWKEPLGMKLPGKYSSEVIGVVKDFHIESLHSPILPAVLALKPDDLFKNSTDVSYNSAPQPRVAIRFPAGDITSQISLLRNSWKSVAGDQDFEYKFLDEALNNAYQQEQRLAGIIRYAAVLSIFIACMGLFGLATLVVVRRTKEIGIRKVLGADIRGIVMLLSRDFILLVVFASFIAFPLAWWGLQQWLQDFAYKTQIPWFAFPGAALLTLIIALLTVSIQAVKAATANPVKSLRTE